MTEEATKVPEADDHAHEEGVAVHQDLAGPVAN